MLVELAVSELRDPVNSSLWFLTGLGQMAEALVKAERLGEALATVEQGIDRSAGGWLAPELLRIKGELHLVLGNGGTTHAAVDLFQEALDQSRRQGALAWELRAATSLARMLANQGRG